LWRWQLHRLSSLESPRWLSFHHMTWQKLQLSLGDNHAVTFPHNSCILHLRNASAHLDVTVKMIGYLILSSATTHFSSSPSVTRTSIDLQTVDMVIFLIQPRFGTGESFLCCQFEKWNHIILPVNTASLALSPACLLMIGSTP
jgi:hypothetical protein